MPSPQAIAINFLTTSSENHTHWTNFEKRLFSAPAAASGSVDAPPVRAIAAVADGGDRGYGPSGIYI
jgi:hypothetical protein